MTDWAKAMNPTSPLDTEEAALAAAKVSAIGMLIGALHQGVGVWYSTTPAAQEAAARMIEQFTGQAPDPAALAQQGQFGLMLGVGLTLLQLILAAVQWRKPNKVLPILFLILVVWGLGGGVLALLVPAMAAAQPMWLTFFTIVTMLIAGLMHIAGIRGSSALDRIRMDAANTYQD
ncbi:MAG: hypothetical protein H2038_05640 [Brevundimonas sp.]|uniref:hypothetical protein n=1 Tax=Brevundimonas sp. TaxID=1871086 RepID=UPI0017D48FF8|nr:hypothetical protein [Brevundimonas sp.]MBA4804115.1 hypothetical protein [Brevundimonas sp.]